MDGYLRRVSTLRLHSRDESLNRRGAILIEDALSTASLPDADGGRLWIVRKLALGRIRADDPPSAVALRIEARFRESGAVAVHAASPQAAHADAVYFDDDLEPYAALALRVAQGQTPEAWFWPLAARGWNPGLTRDDAMRVLLAGALASSAGTFAALALIRTLLRYGALDPLAAALRFQDGPSLLRAFAWPLPDTAEFHPPPQSQRPPDAPSAAFEGVAAPWFTAWGSTDARSLWLACALYAVERPALAAHTSLAKQASAWLHSVIAPPPAETSDLSAPQPLSPARTREADASQDSPTLRPATPSNADSVPTAAVVSHEPTQTPPREDAPADAFIPPEPRLYQFTNRAGLFFLIPAMQRLGMPAWLEANPHLAQWSIPYLVLRAMAHRVETPVDDPVLAACGELPEEVPAEAVVAVDDWIRRLRRFSRRTARVGLYSLICRSGRMVFTETHIDVFFRLHRADIRIRRAGLDIDPGWTPWLPRVIHFHYLSDEAYDA